MILYKVEVLFKIGNMVISCAPIISASTKPATK